MTTAEIINLLEQMQATKSNALDRYLAHLTQNNTEKQYYDNNDNTTKHRANL